MLFLWFMALTSTGAIVIMSFREVRRYSPHGWPYWGALLLYPSRAVLIWGWIFWLTWSEANHKHFQIGLPQLAVFVILALTSGYFKRWRRASIARLADQNGDNSYRIL